MRRGITAVSFAGTSFVATLLLAPVMRDHGLHGGDAIAWLLAAALWSISVLVLLACQLGPRRNPSAAHLMWSALGASCVDALLLAALAFW